MIHATEAYTARLCDHQHLNSKGIKTAWDGRWYPKTVSNIIKREARLQAG